jgi:ribosomal protein S24E
MKITNKKENKILGRTEYEFGFEKEGPTLSKEEAKKEIIKLTKGKEELIVIKSIRSEFGQEKGRIIARVYENKDRFKEIEEFRKKKNGKETSKK